METSILNEQDDDDIYIVELSRSVHEHYEQSDSEDDENYDVRYENAQDEIQDNRDGHNYGQEHVDKKLDWDTLSGVVVDDVLAVLWMDNGPVTMLTTIHEITGNENRVERVRRRPRETSTNATKVRAVFGTASKKALPIPCIIDDYNHHMGGVDIADQLRRYYAVQLPNFRIHLVWELINAGMEENDRTKKPNTRSRVEELTHQFENIGVNLPKTQYVTSNFELSLLRLSPDGHLPEWRKER
ncbi:9600_t:CDS:2, partial [Paraglomus brasilianum]